MKYPHGSGGPFIKSLSCEDPVISNGHFTNRTKNKTKTKTNKQKNPQTNIGKKNVTERGLRHLWYSACLYLWLSRELCENSKQPPKMLTHASYRLHCFPMQSSLPTWPFWRPETLLSCVSLFCLLRLRVLAYWSLNANFRLTNVLGLCQPYFRSWKVHGTISLCLFFGAKTSRVQLTQRSLRKSDPVQRY